MKITGFKEKISVELNGDCPLGNLILDVIRNITNTDISIVNFWMFHNYLSPGYLSILDFIKLMPRENYLCVTEITGKELKRIIKEIQKGQRGFQPTSGLKQFVKMNSKGEKEIIDVKLYNKKMKLKKSMKIEYILYRVIILYYRNIAKKNSLLKIFWILLKIKKKKEK